MVGDTTRPLINTELAQTKKPGKPTCTLCLVGAVHGSYPMFPSGYKLFASFRYLAIPSGMIGWLAQAAINYPEIKQFITRTDTSVPVKLAWLVPASIGTLPILLTAEQNADSYAKDNLPNTVILFSGGLGIAMAYSNAAINVSKNIKWQKPQCQQSLQFLWASIAGTTGFALLVRKLPDKIIKLSPALQVIALPASIAVALTVAGFRTALIYPPVAKVCNEAKRITALGREERKVACKELISLKNTACLIGAVIAAMTFKDMMQHGFGDPDNIVLSILKIVFMSLALAGITILSACAFKRASGEVYRDFLTSGRSELYTTASSSAPQPSTQTSRIPCLKKLPCTIL